MTTPRHHAKVTDIPGYPCPPRVRDIPKHPHSWGRISIESTASGDVAVDDLGYLWVDGAASPKFQHLNPTHSSPGGIVFWTEHGIGLHIHPKSLPYLRDLSRTDMEPDRWIPVAVVTESLPEFVTTPKENHQ